MWRERALYLMAHRAALRTVLMRQLVLADRGGYRPAPGAEKILVYSAYR